ncbi:unnamed protein product [Phytophthora fragariaefolia]|uniref:Unnamed protein product n=1 Tax=Phytophthora fragariaefolia TaxID=1490495 RepID=A0A9W6XFY8_9STRA|nr:unnamed protein product [Phytophthora fragariaefolia]
MPSEVEDTSTFTLTSPAGSASNFLDALRSRTLLDLSCMREFSLLRTKPMSERNLSRLSVSSAYNMHTEHLHLQHIAKHSQSAEIDNSPRPASPVKQTPSELRFRIAHAHRKISQTADNRGGHVNRAAAPPKFIASPPQPKVSPRSRPMQQGQQQMPKIQLIQRPRSEPNSNSSTLSVAEQHGFLQEQDLSALMAATGYSRAELFARWARFKALCSMAKNPHGVDKETLRHGIPQLSVEDQFFVDRAFDVLDKDGSGGLDWPEFIAALSALEKGDATRRVDFLFHAYDLNGDGFIQRHEVQLFFLASLLVPQTPQALEVARQVVDKIFVSLGREQYDSIRVEDATVYLHEHPATDAYSLLGRTMVSSTPSTPLPNSRQSSKLNRLEENEVNGIRQNEHNSPEE